MIVITVKGRDTMKTLRIAPVVAILGLLGLGAPVAAPDPPLRADLDDKGENFQSRAFCGNDADFQQSPPVITTGMGKFNASINADGTIAYKLQYLKLTGTGDVNFADIHFGQEKVNGGIILFLCSNVPVAVGITVPPDTPLCPKGTGTGDTVRGKIVAGSIVGPAAQGINPGDLAAALKALRSGLVYAQVHTVAFTGGEIRGQIDKED